MDTKTLLITLAVVGGVGLLAFGAGEAVTLKWKREGFIDGIEVSEDCREIRIYDLDAFVDWVGRSQETVNEWRAMAANDPEMALSMFTDQLGCPKDEEIIYHRRDGFTHTGNEYITQATQAEDSSAFLEMLFAI